MTATPDVGDGKVTTTRELVDSTSAPTSWPATYTLTEGILPSACGIVHCADGDDCE